MVNVYGDNNLNAAGNMKTNARYFSTLCKSMFMIAAVETGVLLAGAMVIWQDSGFGGGWRLAMLVSCIIGAMGVIWLGWYGYKLGREITSIANRLVSEDVTFGETSGSNKAIEGLTNAISNCLQGRKNRIVALEEQSDDLRIQLRLAQKQKLNTEAIIYGIRDAVIVTDEFDKLIISNETAGKLFNYDSRNSKHKPIGELIQQDESQFVSFLQQSRRSRTPHTRHEFKISRYGEEKIYDCIVSCIYDEKQNVCGVVAVLHDITREKEAARNKNDFVSHVSHELKAPLASISAYAEMLVDGEADTEDMRKEFYSVIQTQANRLNRLIEDILNISRIESGLIKIDKKPVSIEMILREQIQMIKSFADEKNITIVSPDTIVFGQVYGDKDMISQVVVNLLSNAIKYTPAGGTVTVQTEMDEAAGVGRVSITDTGVGIPEADIEHLFSKFYRVEANKKHARGTGLGLNLVKQIVEKVHGGKVFVHSSVGKGSTFGFELPLAASARVRSTV